MTSENNVDSDVTDTTAFGRHLTAASFEQLMQWRSAIDRRLDELRSELVARAELLGLEVIAAPVRKGSGRRRRNGE